MFNLYNKIALITGVARGMGRTHALALASQGATVVLTAILLTSCVSPLADRGAMPASKLYVAIEGENRIAVLDPATQKAIKSIDLSERVGGIIHEFSPHNIQVAPDGKSVWVTANHGHGGHDEDGEHKEDEAPKFPRTLLDPA